MITLTGHRNKHFEWLAVIVQMAFGELITLTD
jgi:hypothetical protein